MSADVLLSRLQGVKRTGQARWLATCPAHEDRRASLSVRDDGEKMLIHCFALCDRADIISAIGLDWSALYHDHDWAGKRFRKAPGIPASDILKALDFESLVVSVIANDMLQKREIRVEDFERLSLARERINAARSACHGQR
jgi:hypothetical protein